MTVNRLPPDDPREWLNRANSNLLHAQTIIEGVYLEDLCFDAQHAAEKAIKAILIGLQVKFPYTHDLAMLLALVNQAGFIVPEQIENAARLTRYAVAERYPGVVEPVTKQEYKDAVSIATEVIHWAESIIK